VTWSPPFTAVAGSVFTAAQFNQYVRDNLNETGPAIVTAAGQYLVSDAANSLAARSPSRASVNTSQTTTATSYGDLATVGPVVTVVTGTSALVTIGSALQNSGTANSLMGWAVSGASTIAVTDDVGGAYGTTGATVTGTFLQTGLTPGSNVFTAKYQVSAGTGTFTFRNITVLPF
jgi:hypothetical protein